ncbi:NUDIX domain-containing protein [Candidatus Woesearchaeota archaeon]|nr:NUDIX domain-containing protein [Candidatus Woesearchaeota archaeon]
MKDILDIIKEFSKKLPKFKDGRIDYSKSNEAPVITVFIKFKDKILLLKRSDKVLTYKGKWNTIAGYLDEVKPIEDKVKEELREKINVKEFLSIKIGKYFKILDKKINKKWIVTPVLVELKDKPEIKLDWEHTEFEWIKPEEMKNYDTVVSLDKSLEKVIS